VLQLRVRVPLHRLHRVPAALGHRAQDAHAVLQRERRGRVAGDVMGRETEAVDATIVSARPKTPPFFSSSHSWWKSKRPKMGWSGSMFCTSASSSRMASAHLGVRSMSFSRFVLKGLLAHHGRGGARPRGRVQGSVGRDGLAVGLKRRAKVCGLGDRLGTRGALRTRRLH